MDALETLVNPPFAKDPPVKMELDAKLVGIVLAILAALSILYGLSALFLILGFGSLLAAYSGFFALAFIAVVVGLVGDVMALIGGWQMYQARPEGKRLAIYGVALAFIGALISMVAFSFGSGFVQLIILALIYYAIVVSRFPGSQPAAS